MHDDKGVYSVALNGPTVSTFSPGNFAINISDSYGDEPTSSGAPGSIKPTSTNSMTGGGPGGSNTAMQIGAGLGAFVVLVALVYLWFRRRKRVPSRLQVLQDQQQYRPPPAVAEIPAIKVVNIPPAYHAHAAPILISTQAPPPLAHHGYANATPIMKPMPPLPNSGEHIYDPSQVNPHPGSVPSRSPQTILLSRSPHSALPSRSPEER